MIITTIGGFTYRGLVCKTAKNWTRIYKDGVEISVCNHPTRKEIEEWCDTLLHVRDEDVKCPRK